MAARQTANGKATVAHFDEIPSQPQPDTGAEWKPVRHFFDLVRSARASTWVTPTARC